MLSFAITSACVNMVLVLATMLLYGLALLLMFTCLASAVGAGDPTGERGTGGGLLALGGVGFIGWFFATLVATVAGFIVGFIYGLIFALAYNLAAKMTGGVEVELH